jgi:hypothetical protein
MTKQNGSIQTQLDGFLVVVNLRSTDVPLALFAKLAQAEEFAAGVTLDDVEDSVTIFEFKDGEPQEIGILRECDDD